MLHIFDGVEQLEGFGVTLGKQLFEIALESEMTAVEHEWIDIAPDLRQIRDETGSTVEIGRSRNRDVGVNLRTPMLSRWNGDLLVLDYGGRHLPENVLGQYLLAKLRIHDLVHETQTCHGVLGIEGGSGVVRTNFGLGELFG